MGRTDAICTQGWGVSQCRVTFYQVLSSFYYTIHSYHHHWDVLWILLTVVKVNPSKLKTYFIDEKTQQFLFHTWTFENDIHLDQDSFWSTIKYFFYFKLHYWLFTVLIFISSHSTINILIFWIKKILCPAVVLAPTSFSQFGVSVRVRGCCAATLMYLNRQQIIHPVSCNIIILFSCDGDVCWCQKKLVAFLILPLTFPDKQNVDEWDCQACFELSSWAGLQGNTGKVHVRMSSNSWTQISWTERAQLCLQSQ